ncbi:hypothetical protein Droror1_Dr00020743 [Drosera rotundifolia]
MKTTGWDLDLVASSVYSAVGYAKKRHNRYAFLSYVCLKMFQGFDSECYGFYNENGSEASKQGFSRLELRVEWFGDLGPGSRVAVFEENEGVIGLVCCELGFDFVGVDLWRLGHRTSWIGVNLVSGLVGEIDEGAGGWIRGWTGQLHRACCSWCFGFW